LLNYWKRLLDALSAIRTILFYVAFVVLLTGGGTFFLQHPRLSGTLLAAGLIILALALYATHPSNLRILDVKPEVTNNPQITYKSKLRVVVQNNTKRQLRLGYVLWGYGRKEVPSDPTWYIFQGQDPSGFWQSSHWGPELKSIEVEPGKVFRVSIALPPGTTDVQIRSAHARRELGIVRLVVNGSDQPRLSDLRL
jgi:hypothetical protein